MPGNSPSDVLVADGVCAVTTTVATPEDARRLAQAVLQQRLAACVQVEPITSHYRWQGALHEEAEWRLVCKTVAGSVAGLLQLLQAQHPLRTAAAAGAAAAGKRRLCRLGAAGDAAGVAFSPTAPGRIRAH